MRNKQIKEKIRINLFSATIDPFEVGNWYGNDNMLRVLTRMELKGVEEQEWKRKRGEVFWADENKNEIWWVGWHYFRKFLPI